MENNQKAKIKDKQMKKMGGMEGVLSMLPGVSKIKKQMDNANIDENIIKIAK